MLQAAVLYVSKCKLMGGRWCRYNKMTERLEFLHLELSETDKFCESWAMVSTRAIQQEQEGKGKGNGKVAEVPTPARTRSGGPEPASKKPRNPVDDLICKASRVKTKYHSTTGACSAFKLKANTDEEPGGRT